MLRILLEKVRGNELLRYVRKARSLPPRVLAKAIIYRTWIPLKNAARDGAKKISAYLFVAGLSNKRFWRQIANFDSKSSEELVEHLRKREKPRFPLGLQAPEVVETHVDGFFTNARERIISRAKRTCEHVFDLLGSGPIKLTAQRSSLMEKENCFAAGNRKPLDIGYSPIDWGIDSKPGYRWSSNEFYLDIIKKIPYGKADIKVPWELSRFHHLTTLGQAYWIATADLPTATEQGSDSAKEESKEETQGDSRKRYAKEFVNEIEDWIENNPPQFGVNWACTMEVAIRACNWISGYSYFKDSSEVTNEFLLKFLKSLYQHGRHIMSNLEWSETLTSNHYLSDIVGLIYLGVMFPEFKEAKKWRDFGIQELIKEMEKQVYPDGCDFEASTCYHRLVLELFFYSTLLVVINDKDFNDKNYKEITEKIFGKEYTEKLYKMFDAVLYLLKPNGKIPQIGDNDSGQLFKLYPREVLDMRYLLAFGAVFFKKSKWKIKEFFESEEDITEVLITYGEKGQEIWDSLEWDSLKNIKSKSFPDAGWYVMRDDKNYCIISCGPNGQNGNGGHCHNDKLSFELCINGEDVIVDPGTYVYTPDPEARNRFRGTAYHNTVMVDDEEQNRFDKYSVFRMSDDALCKCLKWEPGKKVDIFVGEHYGYNKLKQPVVHQREIRFHKKEGRLEIIDEFRGEGEHNLKWNLILSPEVKQELEINSDKLQWCREPTFYSPEYGIIINIEKFSAALKIMSSAEFRINLIVETQNKPVSKKREYNNQ